MNERDLVRHGRRRARWSAPKHVDGFDGLSIGLRTRVAVHPACDLFMQGAHFGVVTALAGTALGVRVRVRMDHPGVKRSQWFAVKNGKCELLKRVDQKPWG